MTTRALTVDEATCEALVAEARQQTRPQRSALASCVGMKVQEGHLAASILHLLGWPFSDAQVVGYGEGGRYELHTDGAGRDEALMVQLSPPDAYGGGHTFIHEPEGIRQVSQELGSVHIWPGAIPHEVTEVLYGERWALVAWRPAEAR